MIDHDDPQRLRDAASGSPLGDALRAAERDVGSEEQVASLAAKLGPLLAAPVAATTTAASVGTAAKVGLGALALIVAGGGAWLLSTSQSASPPVPTPTAVHAPAPPVADPAPAVAAVPVAPEASAPVEATPSAAKLAEKPVPPAQPSEAELLEQARSALKGDPARALARANQHAARFPGGALVQEREVIAIKALRQLGRSAEAERRAQAFAKAYPGSAFARKLQTAP